MSGVTSSFLEEYAVLSQNDESIFDLFIEKIRTEAGLGTSNEDLQKAKELADNKRNAADLLRRKKAAQHTINQYGELSASNQAVKARIPIGEASNNIDDLASSFAENFIRSEDEQIAYEASEDIAKTFNSIEDSVIPTVYKRFNPKETAIIKAIMKNKGTTAGIAAIALGVGIFASIRKKEHTQQGVAGPPLIPGGNPYERIPAGSMSYPDAPGGSTEQMGTSYNVSVNGDSEQMREFSARAGLVTNGQVGSTMYNSLPDLGRDHYGDIAGSF